MSQLRLLIVEDSETDLQTYRDTIERYEDEKGVSVETNECKSIEEASKAIFTDFDAAVIDLRLSNKGEGNEINKLISDINLRIPTAVFTGTPDEVCYEFPLLGGVYKKGETEFTLILDKLWNIHNTGLSRIMSGKGEIENALNAVYSKNIFPLIDKWIEYGIKDSKATEKALLRFTISHLQSLLDGNDEKCFPIEMYITPTLHSGQINTGSLVKSNQNGSFFIILTPACDLAIRKDGNFKTDTLLLAEIENETLILAPALQLITKADKRRKTIRDAFSNNLRSYYHYLPSSAHFDGGYINFRKIQSVSKETITGLYDEVNMQVAPNFTKDIVARFSSYYARQGQPDLSLEFVNSEFKQD